MYPLLERGAPLQVASNTSPQSCGLGGDTIFVRCVMRPGTSLRRHRRHHHIGTKDGTICHDPHHPSILFDPGMTNKRDLMGQCRIGPIGMHAMASANRDVLWLHAQQLRVTYEWAGHSRLSTPALRGGDETPYRKGSDPGRRIGRRDCGGATFTRLVDLNPHHHLPRQVMTGKWS